MNFTEEALDSTGIYPAATAKVDEKGKEISSEKRTKWEDGWNACYFDIITKAALLETWFNKLKLEEKEALEFFKEYGLQIYFKKETEVNENSNWIAYREDKKIAYKEIPIIALNCSDTFCWGCADSEEISLEELTQLKNLSSEIEKSEIGWLSIAFAALKRNCKLMNELKIEQKRVDKLIDLIKNKTSIIGS
jgi:hypothetical protein